ncbi:hypothetical protein [Methanosphaera sp.]
MNKKKIQRKTIGSLFILVSIYYLVAEYMTINHTTSIIDAYVYQPVLDINLFSGQVIQSMTTNHTLISIAFILLGVMILLGCFLEVNKRINKFEIFYYPLMLITCVGAILLGCYYNGFSEVIGSINLAYFMLLLGGNLLLIIIGKSVNFNKTYKRIITLLGYIGLISTLLIRTSLNISTIVMYSALFERVAIYMIIIWTILTGICLITE